jgi:hypothetical protein
MSSQIAVLKVTLDGVKPTMMRRLVVPLTIRLDRLHLVLQAAIGWTNSHLYEISARGIGWGIQDPDFGDGPLDARKARLVDVLEDCGVKTLKYLYDFGDGWEHTVKVERVADAIPGLTSPFLVDAVGRCPPEDVGGPSGYAEFLEIMSDTAHESYAETRQWVGEHFDPSIADLNQLSHAVDALAAKWSRTATGKKTRSRI